MNKSELSQAIAEKLNLNRKDVEQIVETFTDVVTDTIKGGGEVTIAGFGAFSARRRKGRSGVNPQNPSEKIQIPDVVVPKFKAGKNLKDALKGKGAATPTVVTPAPASKPVAPTVAPTPKPAPAPAVKPTPMPAMPPAPKPVPAPSAPMPVTAPTPAPAPKPMMPPTPPPPPAAPATAPPPEAPMPPVPPLP